MPHATKAPIGTTLRSAREKLGNSVEEAAWRTRIKPDYLRALEDERFEDIGHHAIARGHLHTYARYLGLEADELSREYRKRFEHSQPSPIERLNEQVKESKRPPKPKWLIAALLSTAVLIALGLTGIVRGPGPRTTPAADTLSTLPSSLDPSTPPSIEPSAAVPPVAAAPVSVALVAEGRSWVRATVDGKVLFEGTLEAGATKSFSGNDRIDIVIGNAGAMRITVNGEDRGLAGKPGRVYRASFGPRGDIASQ